VSSSCFLKPLFAVICSLLYIGVEDGEIQACTPEEEEGGGRAHTQASVALYPWYTVFSFLRLDLLSLFLPRPPPPCQLPTQISKRSWANTGAGYGCGCQGSRWRWKLWLSSQAAFDRRLRSRQELSTAGVSVWKNICIRVYCSCVFVHRCAFLPCERAHTHKHTTNMIYRILQGIMSITCLHSQKIIYYKHIWFALAFAPRLHDFLLRLWVCVFVCVWI
jgi:hypothetical protein